MRSRQLLIGLAVALLAIVAVPTAASAANGPSESPAQLCKATENFGGYLASTGGCASSVASIGVEALMEFAFPSRAAAVANCKQIAAFYGGFPFNFYAEFYPGNPAYTATNINSCVGILYLLHTGELPGAPG